MVKLCYNLKNRTEDNMFISDALNINEKNHLTIGGADTVELAKEYGTPLYVMDENTIVSNMRAYKDVIDKEYDGNGLIFFASKSMCTKETCRIAAREGLGIDVVSGGEMFTALSAGVSPSVICFHGNNKGYDELEFAITNGIGRIMADSFDDIERVNEIAGRLGKKQKILVRVTPGIEASTHEFVMTGGEDSKFGISIKTGEAKKAIAFATQCENIILGGIHCHIGSQIFDTEPFEKTADVMVKFISELDTKIDELDLGGGFGIRYTEEDKHSHYSDYMSKTIKALKISAKKYSVQLPFLMFEPGRSIVGAAGITLYTAGVIKDLPGIRKYVSLDGGMGDNPRFIMYGSKYEALLPSRPLDEKTETVTLCGKCCESGDIIIKDAKMPKINRGDLVAVLSTGAYNYSMSSNYNRLPRPAVVMIKDGKSRIIVKRETYEDLLRNDL